METNFSFLESKKEYELFAGACIDAECILESSPVMSAVASRKALELGVKWVYSIDSALKPIGYREGLQSLLHNNGFPSLRIILCGNDCSTLSVMEINPCIHPKVFPKMMPFFL